MAIYYVSPSGLDANNGLGPDASHATNKPWLTLGKVFATGSTVVPGDTIWFGPGKYMNAAVTTIAGISSAATPSFFRGDPTNSQGFRTSGGVLLAPAPVHWDSARAAAGEDSAGTLTTLLNFGGSGNHFFNIVMEAGASVLQLQPASLSNFLFEDCRMVSNASSGAAINLTNAAPTAGRNWTFRRCTIIGNPSNATVGGAINLNVTTAAATANADLGITFEACIIVGNLSFQLGTAAGNKAGGIDFNDCTFLRSTISSVASTVSLAAADNDRLGVHLRRSIVWGLVNMGTGSHLRDDGYCRYFTGTHTNISSAAGAVQAATSVLRPQFNLVMPDLIKWGYPADWVGRNTFGWSDEAVAAQTDSGGTSTVQDFNATGLTRPWGAGPSIGAIEYPSVTRDTATLIDGVDSLKISGKGDVDFLVPVEAAATVITVKARQDASYGAGTKPQLLILAEPSIGVVAQTITGVAAVSTNETLTAASFTPTASGVVTVRLRSQAATAGSAAFDSLSRS